jgi:SAM-dependent methyltransferase
LWWRYRCLVGIHSERGKLPICTRSRSKRFDAFQRPQWIETRQTTIEDFDAGDTQFDVVLMRQVLHYIQDPSSAVSKLRRILHRNGCVYIGQIVAPSPEARKWLSNLGDLLSTQRKRVWLAEDIWHLMSREGFRLSSARIHLFDDDLVSWSQRATNAITAEHLLRIARRSLTDGVCRDLGVEDIGSTIQYKVPWFHSVFDVG